MISHKYKCIFIRQRKAAGSSIVESFGISRRRRAWSWALGLHEPYGMFTNGTLGDDWTRRELMADGYVVFTVIRNPWDRFVSGWTYLDGYRQRPLREVVADLPAKGHDYRHLARPQLDTLVDSKGLFVPDYVLRFENLQEDFVALCRIIGKKDARLGHLNKTSHAPYETYYDAFTREAVAKLFAQDIEAFGYEFGGAARPTKTLGARLLS